jgi:hypothetical protein
VAGDVLLGRATMGKSFKSLSIGAKDSTEYLINAVVMHSKW